MQSEFKSSVGQNSCPTKAQMIAVLHIGLARSLRLRTTCRDKSLVTQTKLTAQVS